MSISPSKSAGPQNLSLPRLFIITCLFMLPVLSVLPVSPIGPVLQAQTRSDSADVDVRLRERSRALEAADADLRSARLALEEARRRQLAGEEPLPGERSGNVGGKSRLNEAYFTRQASLKQAVAQAEQPLERAQAGFNELR
jgi:hypothetical protein